MFSPGRVRRVLHEAVYHIVLWMQQKHNTDDLSVKWQTPDISVMDQSCSTIHSKGITP